MVWTNITPIYASGTSVQADACSFVFATTGYTSVCKAVGRPLASVMKVNRPAIPGHRTPLKAALPEPPMLGARINFATSRTVDQVMVVLSPTPSPSEAHAATVCQGMVSVGSLLKLWTNTRRSAAHIHRGRTCCRCWRRSWRRRLGT